MIIAVANSKGGVGKTTVAGHLAVWLQEQGYNVAIADCDPQESCQEWMAEAEPKVKVVTLSDPDYVVDELPVLGGEFDYVVADGPGSQNEMGRVLMLRADLAIIPCKASVFEARALSKNTAFLRQARDIRNGPPEAVAVLSMVGKNFRLTRDMREAAGALDLPVAKTQLTLRQAYADAPGQGTVVWRMGRSEQEAAKEISTLFCEILPEAATGKVVEMKKEAKKRSGTKKGKAANA